MVLPRRNPPANVADVTNDPHDTNNHLNNVSFGVPASPIGTTTENDSHDGIAKLAQRRGSGKMHPATPYPKKKLRTSMHSIETQMPASPTIQMGEDAYEVQSPPLTNSLVHKLPLMNGTKGDDEAEMGNKHDPLDQPGHPLKNQGGSQDHLRSEEINSTGNTNNDIPPEQGEPDWEKLADHEPAKTDVPFFLAARDKRIAAEERYGAALDECNDALTNSTKALLQTAADIHQRYSANMDSLEDDIRNHLVCNDDAREAMQVRLEQTATAAQGLFAQLLRRVGHGALAGPLQAAMNAATTLASATSDSNIPRASNQ